MCGYISIYRDITEQKEAEDRQRFQAQLLDSVRESVMALNTEGNVIFWGRGAEELFGYSQDEALNRQMTSLIYPPSAGGMKEWRRIRDHVFEGRWWNKQVTRRKKDGSDFCADVAAAPIRDEAGKPIGLIAIHLDTTDRQRDQAMLRDSHKRLRDLTSRLMKIREQERSAIARELHDELGQALTRLNIDLRSLIGRLPERLRDARTTSLIPFVDDLLGKVQHISAQLRPAILDDLGLEAAIEWQVQEFARWNKGIRGVLQLNINSLQPHPDRDTAIFRIVQEALTNIARHAKANCVKVHAGIRGGELSVDVADNGVGIPESQTINGQSLGIVGMRERAETIGGRLTLAQRKPKGTIVSLRVPLKRTYLAGVS
jgi:PAS domain S-box-containing protein